MIMTKRALANMFWKFNRARRMDICRLTIELGARPTFSIINDETFTIIGHAFKNRLDDYNIEYKLIVSGGLLNKYRITGIKENEYT